MSLDVISENIGVLWKAYDSIVQFNIYVVCRIPLDVGLCKYNVLDTMMAQYGADTIGIIMRYPP